MSPITRCTILAAAALLPAARSPAAVAPAFGHSNQDGHVLHSNQDHGAPSALGAAFEGLTAQPAVAWVEAAALPGGWLLPGPEPMPTPPNLEDRGVDLPAMLHGNSPRGPEPLGGGARPVTPVPGPAGWLVVAAALLAGRRRRGAPAR